VSWILTLLGIVLLIVLHELGHFTAAKAVGMRVERFSLFFPPTIFRIRRGETEYAIGAIPAGGYVKITGMSPEELQPRVAGAGAGALASALPGTVHGAPDTEGSEEPAGPDPELVRRAYYAQAPWKRILVILAGPGVNILIAFLLFWLVLLSGNLDGSVALSNLDPSLRALATTTAVQAIQRGEPADGVLRAGDRIVAVDGRPATVSSAQQAIASHRCAGSASEGCRARTPAQLTIRRAGRDQTVLVYPRYSQEVKRMLVGFDFGVTPRSFTALAAAGAALGAMWHTTTNMLTNIGHAFTSEKVRHEFHSIIGITEVAHETVIAGAGFALVFLGFISLVLAVINLFPFLPLDGGHILWSVAEKVRGRRISLMAMYRFSSVGIVLLLFLVINGVSNDISRLTG
jgi:regulator of sigma E protease